MGSVVYSGNFLAQAEVDTHCCTRVLMGIHPQNFSWNLNKGDSFVTPEVVMVYSACGINKMNQTYHKLYRTRLARVYNGSFFQLLCKMQPRTVK